ncbi:MULTISPECIES: hypothetical protein [Actinomyces]|uniref:Uncharacterized protein n=1 Tax=Actinomyces respiraculi TaxID=2744574 RepID=A0A7T0PV80_9ACTO|nr:MULTISPECIES: hypothetical protein [Actinomyces]QPL05016.1 hypothetical protein ID810_09745 [Actinomyces respiraculi]
MTPLLSRRQALGVASAVASVCVLGALTSCSARSEVLPRGWDRVLTHGVLVPVRSEWEHRTAPDDVPLWTDLWVAQDASVHLLVGSPTAGSHEAALVEARAALRAALPGYAVRTTTSTVDGSERRLSMEDFTTSSPGFEAGRLWVVSGAETIAAVALTASQLSHADCEVIVAGMSLGPVAGAGTPPEGWARVGRGDVTVLVPKTWRTFGAVPGSKRWTDSWADADPDGLSRARLLLCSDTGARTREDALARIESDSVSGAVPGYRAVSDHALQVNGASATRRDFTFDGGNGALWVIDVHDTVGAVQLTVIDAALTASPGLIGDVEGGLWVRGHET